MMSITKVLVPAGLVAAQNSTCDYLTIVASTCESEGLALATPEDFDTCNAYLGKTMSAKPLKSKTYECQLAFGKMVTFKKADGAFSKIQDKYIKPSSTECSICTSACRARDDEVGLMRYATSTSATCANFVATYGCATSKDQTGTCVAPGKSTNAEMVYQYCPATCQASTKFTTSTTCKKCNKPVDCKVSEWSGFSTCTVTCAGGTQTRTRTITPAKFGGKPCNPAQPALQETKDCNTDLCPKPGCMNKDACNYDPFATEDNRDCKQFDKCGVCGGDGSTCSSNCYALSTAAAVAAMLVAN